MARRHYTVALPAEEAQRLHAFNNKKEGKVTWPLGPNKSFMRKNATTFTVKDWTNMGFLSATVTTLGIAKFTDEKTMNVTIKNKAQWLGWLLLAVGLMCIVLVYREGILSALLGVALIVVGYFAFLKRSFIQQGLDEVEAVLRSEIKGDWK